MEFQEVVETRRAVHQYADEDVDRETLAEIFRPARLAPSGYDLQPREFLVVRDEAAKADVENDRKVRQSVEEVVHRGSFDPVAETTVEPGWLPGPRASRTTDALRGDE